MKLVSIAMIAGDGIGKEVVPAARQILKRIGSLFQLEFRFEDFGWGAEHFFARGKMMPPNALELLEPHDAILLGAVGHPDIPDHITLQGLLLPLRRGFDLYANVRPARLYPGVECPLRGYPPKNIDLVVVRENTEGEYAPAGGFLRHHLPDEVAVQTAIFTRKGCERIVRYAFELARKRGRARKVTSITKSNAQAYGMVLWDRTFQAVAAEYADVAAESLLVDAAAMDLVRRPRDFDVVVASNLFGDILSDLAAMVTGSIGLAASANLDPERRFPSLFEPVHGSAPDIAGQNRANPLAAILSASLLLDHLGEGRAAGAIDEAVASVLESGTVRTPDLGGTAATAELTGAVLAQLG